MRLWGRKIIQGIDGFGAFWVQRCIYTPALDWKNCRWTEVRVVISYRTSSGIVQALLDVANDGLITWCRCGPV